MFERELRQLSFVPRWVITRNLRTQSVAEHSFYVAVYAEQLAIWLGYEGDWQALIHAALWHDAEECFTGDIPGPTKRSIIDSDRCEKFIMKGLKERFGNQVFNITEEQRVILKIANLLDEVFYQAGEEEMGNLTAAQSKNLSIKRLKAAVESLPLTAFTVVELWGIIQYAIMDHNGAGQDKLPTNDDDLATHG